MQNLVINLQKTNEVIVQLVKDLSKPKQHMQIKIDQNH